MDRSRQRELIFYLNNSDHNKEISGFGGLFGGHTRAPLFMYEGFVSVPLTRLLLKESKD